LTDTALLVLAGLLVLAYLLDLFGRRVKLPSVVLLIATGMIARIALERLGVQLHFVDQLLPVVGTIGLILIVLEGSLDLELRRKRLRLIARSSSAALLGFVATLAAFTALLHWMLGFALPVAALAAMPFAVISSAVAIPSAHGLPDTTREFVVYESALSDILGVLVFYAWLGASGSLGMFTSELFGGGALSLLAAVAFALLLFFIINRIEGHVRFVPLLAGLMLLYAVGKVLHLSPLVLVLVCGLLLNNPHLLERTRYLKAMHGPGYDKTLGEFKGLVAELTFATKSVFFIMLGYWTDLSHMADWRAWALAAAMVVVIYASRAVILFVLRVQDPKRLLWIAPRGLITVLLYLTAADTGTIEAFPFGTVMLVVLVTATITALSHRDDTGEPADHGAREDAASAGKDNGEPAAADAAARAEAGDDRAGASSAAGAAAGSAPLTPGAGRP
jgi:cell volume regulation protein A